MEVGCEALGIVELGPPVGELRRILHLDERWISLGDLPDGGPDRPHVGFVWVVKLASAKVDRVSIPVLSIVKRTPHLSIS